MNCSHNKTQHSGLKRLLLLFLLLLVSAVSVQTSSASDENPRLGHFRVVGAQRFSSQKIMKWLALKSGDTVVVPDLLQRCKTVLLRLQEAGYYFARIDSVESAFSTDSATVDVSVHLTPGELVRVSAYTVRGVPEEQKAVLHLLRLQVGKIFRPVLLEQDIEMLLQRFENSGFPYCRVVLDEIAWKRVEPGAQAGLSVSLEVEPGAKVSISEIVILGNSHTKNQTILRELPVAIADFYQQSHVDQIPTELMNLGFFKWVNPAHLELLNDGSGRLIVELAEGNQNLFDGIVGYNPATTRSAGFLTGMVDFKFGNLFGTGRQLAARWERRSRETQALDFGYTEPWIAGLPIEGTFRFQQLIQDTTYIEREVTLGARYRISRSLRLTAGISRSEVSPDSVGTVRFGIQPSSRFNFSLGIAFGNIDHPINPMRGVVYETTFRWSGKSSGSTPADSSLQTEITSATQKHLAIDFESYLPLFRWQVLAIGLHGREVKSNASITPIPDQYRFGGARTLRGYREQQFRGERVVWTNIEYRYILGTRSRVFLFGDAGYFSLREFAPAGEIVEKNNLKIGYGFGVRLDTRLGLVAIDFGLGEEDNLSSAKVHIGLINEF